MANIKISQLPEVSTLASTDVLPSVATATTSKITLKNLGNAISGVTSSISASFASTASFVKNAQTASYVLQGVSASFASTASYVVQAVSASHAVSASYLINAIETFPYTGSAKITGSLVVTGSIYTSKGVYLSDGIYIKDSVGDSNNYIYVNPNDSLTLVGYGDGVKIVDGGGTLIATVSSGTNNFVLTGSALISGSLTVLAELNATSSQAFTASYVDGNSFTTDNKALSASNSATASYVDGNSFTVDNPALSASYALTASYALNGGGGAAFPYTGTAQINGKLVVTGSLINGSITNAASGLQSHAEGSSTTASGIAAHSEGFNSTATGDASHAEGDDTDAIGDYSHAEGRLTKSSGSWSHAEGSSTLALGGFSHAEGRNTFASGAYSHTEGHFTTASSAYSHAEGYNTIASAFYQHVQGQFNLSSTNQSAFIIGNGAGEATRSNLVYASGSNFEVSGSLLVTGSFNMVNGFAVLQQVSESLNFVDDAAAATGGVPLGGLYRNGNFVVIRIA